MRFAYLYTSVLLRTHTYNIMHLCRASMPRALASRRDHIVYDVFTISVYTANEYITELTRIYVMHM